MLRFRDKLEETSVALLSKRRAITSARIGQTPLEASEDMRMIIEQLVQVLAPVVREISAHSLSPDELVLRRMMGDDWREEISSARPSCAQASRDSERPIGDYSTPSSSRWRARQRKAYRRRLLRNRRGAGKSRPQVLRELGPMVRPARPRRRIGRSSEGLDGESSAGARVKRGRCAFATDHDGAACAVACVNGLGAAALVERPIFVGALAGANRLATADAVVLRNGPLCAFGSQHRGAEAVAARQRARVLAWRAAVIAPTCRNEECGHPEETRQSISHSTRLALFRALRDFGYMSRALARTVRRR